MRREKLKTKQAEASKSSVNILKNMEKRAKKLKEITENLQEESA